MGRESWRGKQRRTLSLSEATDLLRCCFLLQVLPPPPAREAQPNDGKVIHHWSTTAANWISPPPINVQSGLAKVSRKGWGWGAAAGMKVGRGVGLGGCSGWGRLPAFPLEGRSPAAGRKMGLVEQWQVKRDTPSISSKSFICNWHYLKFISTPSPGTLTAPNDHHHCFSQACLSLGVRTHTHTQTHNFRMRTMHTLIRPLLLFFSFLTQHTGHACAPTHTHTLLHRAL